MTFEDENFGHQEELLSRDCGDFILRRSDGVYAYQLAVAEDDGRMGITRVVRGWDFFVFYLGHFNNSSYFIFYCKARIFYVQFHFINCLI